MRRVAPTLLAVLAAAALWSGAGSAAAATVIESATIENGYPGTLTFKVTASADTNITDVTLRYSLKGRGTGALGKPESLAPARNLSAEVVLQVNSASNYIPVGSEFTYHWEITTADGATFTGPESQFLFLPPNREWKSVSNEFMVVYYHGERQSIANAYLKAGEDTYQRIGRELYGVELELSPVKVIMFADEAESDLARPGTGGRFDAAVTTCGTKVTNDIVLVIPIACGSADRTDTLRHEFGHILNQTAGEGTLAKLPAWVDEGAAVYAQSTPGEYSQAFEAAARANRLIPFAQMAVPASNPAQVGIFYGQAWAMVSYLIEEKGAGKFAEFMRTVKGGRRYDQALTQVYGYANVQAFEDEFRAAVGAGQQASPTPRPTSAATPTPRPQATATPTRAAAGGAASSDDGDGEIGTGTIVIGGLAALFLLGAVFAFLLSMMMANNRKANAGSATPGPDWRPPDGTPGGGE